MDGTVTKLQIGAEVGARTCTLIICMHLYKITRLRATDETVGQVCMPVLIWRWLSVLNWHRDAQQ